MEQDAVTEFSQARVLDLGMQCLKSLTVMVCISCVITRFEVQKQGPINVKEHSHHHCTSRYL
jgi:hypothetical protein